MKKILVIWSLLFLSLPFLSAQQRKTISVLGDSYSTFQGCMQPNSNAIWYFSVPKHQTDVTKVEQTWWHLFVKDNGYELDVNNSFSGSTVCNTGYHQKDYTDCSFITRMKQVGNPDVLLVFGGTNDSWAGVPIGEYRYADWTQEELFHFRPAMAYLLNYLVQHHPNTRIYFLLNNGLKPVINESVKTICKHYGVPCVELQQIDKQSGHPSIQGMKQISEQLRVFMENEQLQVSNQQEARVDR